MPTTTPPDDLVRLKVRYLESEAEYARIRENFPTGQQIVAIMRDGLTPVADDEAQRAHDAYQLCLNLGKLIQSHAWWRTRPGRADADRALTEAARQQIAAKLDAPVG